MSHLARRSRPRKLELLASIPASVFCRESRRFLGQVAR
jgi:hypothetical protein